MAEFVPPDTLEITDPEHVALLADLYRVTTACAAAIPKYRPLAFGGSLMDALRTGAPIPHGARLHILAGGELDAAAVLAEIEDSGLLVGGTEPVVIDVLTPTTRDWECTRRADTFAYDTAHLTQIAGPRTENLDTVGPVFVTSETAAIVSALAAVDDYAYQRSLDVPEMVAAELAELQRTWFAEATYLLATMEPDFVSRELDNLTIEELRFTRTLMHAYHVETTLEEAVAELAEAQMYELMIEARVNARDLVAGIDERITLIESKPVTLWDRMRRIAGVERTRTTVDVLEAETLSGEPGAGSPSGIDPGMARIYDNFVELREARMAREGQPVETSR